MSDTYIYIIYVFFKNIIFILGSPQTEKKLETIFLDYSGIWDIRRH